MSLEIIELSLGEHWIELVRASKGNEVLWRARDFAELAVKEVIADPTRADEVLAQIRKLADFSATSGYGT